LPHARVDETDIAITLIYGGDFASVARKTCSGSGDVLYDLPIKTVH
jgi:hypothetical protein